LKAIQEKRERNMTGKCMCFVCMPVYENKSLWDVCVCSNSDHQQADWSSIHEKVCPLLVSIHAPAPFGTLELQLILSKNRFQDVLPAALLFLRWVMRVYRSCAVELVPAYLLLVQANIGLGSLSQAHEYLHTVLHQLQRTLGRLHAAAGKYASALTHFANDVSPKTCGTLLLDCITVMSGGYFIMADVFLKQNKPDIAHLFYTEVANSWHAHLCKLMDGITDIDPPLLCVDEAQCVEADQMLRCILEFEEQCVKPRPDQSAMLAHSLAMLWLLCNNYIKFLACSTSQLSYQTTTELPDLSLHSSSALILNC
uniref:Zinc finger, MYND-type containing 12 n=1 Tax=Cyprinus carpio TaxID=7962 RepID=A0A8C2KPQ6_CYPCA